MEHLRSHAIAYVALFFALGGGTAFAVSSAVQADSVDGFSAAKFSREDSAPVPETEVLRLAGTRVLYACTPATRKRGSSADVELDLQSKADDGRVTLAFTTGSDPAGSAFTVREFDLDIGDDFDLDRGRSFGNGQAVFTAASGKVATLDYGFDEGGTDCFAHGVALGG